MGGTFFFSSLLLFVFMLFGANQVLASDYYVATNGNDANSGTLAQPFLTIQKGLNAVSQAGDTLFIRGGNYSVGALSFTNKTGTSSQKIIISGYENERPVLNASGRINALWDNFIFLNNLQHVTIKNLEIANSRTKGVYLARSSDVTFQNVWIHHTALAAIWAEENTNNLIIENSRFWQNNKVNDPTCTSGNTACPGWYAGGQWMGAIHPRGSSSTTGPYTNNVIIRKNEIFESYGECINAHGRVSNLTIEDNTIYNCWAPAIYFPNDKDVLIQRNLVYHTNDSRFLRGGNPGSAIGTQKEAPPTRPGEMKNIRILNNLVKGYSRSFFFWQHLGGYLQDSLIAHNTFVDSHSNAAATHAIDIGPGPHVNTKFENNIIVQDDPTANVGRSDGSVSFSNNRWSKAPPANMSGAGDIVGSIAIARSGNTGAGQLTADYFRLLSNSPAPTPSPSPKPGDLNADGRVDIFDYNILVTDFGRTGAAGFTPADIDGDGDVDIFDYNRLVTDFGKTTGNTPTPTPTYGPTPPSSGVPCSTLSGIERRFPCSPLVAGPMPERPTSGTDAWDMFTSSLYPGTSGNGVNERFSAVANPAGSGVVVRNQNLLSDGENHTTVGTSRDLPNGSTECSAFRWLWKDITEFNPVGWILVWQLQMSGSPIVAISVDESTNNWFFKSRNGSDSGINYTLGPVQYGQWAYFVACTHIADAPNGWTKVWYRNGSWPDINGTPSYQRSGHDTYQGETGHNTIGLYAGGDVPGVSYYGYFDRYGRATTPARAVEIAGN